MAWNLSENSTASLRGLPESGMGFQWVSGTSYGESRFFIVFNATLAFDVTDADVAPGDDPSTALANGIKIINALRRDRQRVIGPPEPHSFILLSSRIGLAAPLGVLAGAPSPQLRTERGFHRFSAFKPDKRIDPVTGAFAPGTYAVPESEVLFLPTGFAVVGRLALPNTQPPSNHYVIRTAKGTLVHFGTVAPAFGQSGGGVEAFFPNGATNRQSPPGPVTTIPDE
jgi:hypothetical protein